MWRGRTRERERETLMRPGLLDDSLTITPTLYYLHGFFKKTASAVTHRNSCPPPPTPCEATICQQGRSGVLPPDPLAQGTNCLCYISAGEHYRIFWNIHNITDRITFILLTSYLETFLVQVIRVHSTGNMCAPQTL